MTLAERTTRTVTVLRALMLGWRWKQDNGFELAVIETCFGLELVHIAYEVTGEEAYLPYPMTLSDFMSHTWEIKPDDFFEATSFIVLNERKA